MSEIEELTLQDAIDGNIARDLWIKVHGTDAAFDGNADRLKAIMREARNASTHTDIRKQYDAGGKAALREIRNLAPQVRDEEFKRGALKRYLTDGGSEDEFDKDWPEIRRARLKAAALKPDDDVARFIPRTW
mgnify:CR=1 FL=1